MRNGNHVGADIIKGAIAGAAATWLMGQVTSWMYEHEGEDAKERENRARGGLSAYERAAEKGADLVNLRLSEPARARAGSAIHWSTGIAAGVAYALARRKWGGITAATGLPFGTAFFLTVDEVMNPLLGLTPGPQAFPWHAHARGFGGHLAFGLANDLILDGLDRVA